MSQITLVDYKIGNLLSVERAMQHIGSPLKTAKSAQDIADAQKLIVPGVGAFKSCIDALKEHEFYDAIIEYAASDKPMLGICVGMQMLFETSHEFGDHQGFGLLPGDVRAIPAETTEGKAHKIPHIGWTPLTLNQLDNPLLQGIPDAAEVYFVHSFTAHPANDANCTADAYYGGQKISAIVNKGNIYGTQFHPEKSGPVGLQILKNFVAL